MHALFDLKGEKKQTGELPPLYDDAEIIEDAFKEFREKGFPYPEMTLAEMKIELNKLRKLHNSKCITSTLGYKIADVFNKHRFEATVLNGSSPVSSYLDDVKLKKALRMSYESGTSLNYGYKGFMSLVNGTQACSNFRPAFAKYIYNKFCKEGGKVFDPSMGYGGRLVGFLASHCGEYHGTDPNKTTFYANGNLTKALRPDNKFIYLYNDPIEDLKISKIKNYFDLCFTSPPYFKKEIYSEDEKQSCNRYPEYQDWLEYFLRPFMRKQCLILKPNGLSVVNIEDVKIGSKKYSLVEPTIKIGKKVGFEFVKTENYNLATARRKKNEQDEFYYEAGKESVLIFRKVPK